MRCFYCENIPESGFFAELSEREMKHLFITLRGRKGELIKLIDGMGSLASAHIEEDRKILIISKEKLIKPKPEIFLYFALPRQSQKMDLILAQCAETGVSSINPLITEYSVSRPDKIPERWKLHIIEGCKQSQNPFFPEIRPVIQLKDAVAVLSQNRDISLTFGSLSDNAFHARDLNGLKDKIAWFVGAEGGFSEQEEKLMIEHGFIPLKIGKWAMRTETAAIAGAALLMNSKYSPNPVLSENIYL